MSDEARRGNVGPGPDPRILKVEGRGLPLRGRDIDTDRIIPARFLTSVRFEGLEDHVFEDDRKMRPAAQGPHPFDVPAYAGARVLVVQRNFGCGSSREHAPQAIYRWGIRAVVGESFADIFFGNSMALGLPCLSVSEADALELIDAIEDDPSTPITVDIERQAVRAATGDWRPATLPAAAHDAFLTGVWDATGMLLADFNRVEATAASLPYVRGF